MYTMEDVTPQAWVECMACRNEGLNNGDWFTLDDLNTLSDQEVLDNIHNYEDLDGEDNAVHEEIWAYDSKNIDTPLDMSVNKVRELADIAAELEGYSLTINDYLAYVDQVGEISPHGLGESFCGFFMQWEDFVREEVESAGILDRALDIDYDSFADDLEYDYEVVEIKGGVLVFSTI